jgi:membrane fusion protein, multidrug efflux system
MRLSNLSVHSLQSSNGLTKAACCLLSALSLTRPVLAQTSAPQKWTAITTPAALSFGSVPTDADQTSASAIRVVVRSYETAALSAEINARITLLPKREGDRFKKGDIIVEFDCRKIVAEHDGAIASLRGHQSVFENQQQLLRYKAAGSLAVNQAQHELEKAKAEVRGLEAKRSGCQITAPFDGRVTEKSAQVHEIAQPNQPILKIINEGKMELVMMVPSNLLSKVADGTRFRVKLDENGDLHEARIVQSTGLIDPVSQSARMIAELIDTPSNVIPGMSGTAMFANHQDTK